MWQERLTHSYEGTELGIAHPMAAAVVRSIWVRVHDRVLGAPYQIAWLPFGGEEQTEDAMVQAYQDFDWARIGRL